MSDLQFPEVGPVEETFYPQDAIGNAIKNTLYVGSAGLFMAAIQNTVSKHNVGAFSVFTRYGSSVALFGSMGGTYAFVSSASANLRGTNDAFNHAYGGIAAGAIAGLRKRAFPAVIGNGIALGVVLGVAAYSGAYMFGTPDMHPAEGRWPTKEEIRKRYRRPLNETINELGEGRGIYGPGYEERRAQRIKENHGIDVPRPYWETQVPAEPMK